MRIRSQVLFATLISVLVALGLTATALASPPSAVTDAPASSDPSLARESARAPISRGKLHRKLASLASQAPGDSGFYVFDLDAKGKHVLYDRSQGRRRKLASNEKLFTTITALHELGASGRIVTRVKRTGTITANGRLKGSLYLVGGGDPSFGSGGIKDLANDVRRAGITSVTGTVVGDDTVFDRKRGVPGTGYDATQDIAPLSGLTYGGSTYSDDPAKTAAAAFRARLLDVGVKIGGKVKVGSVPRKLRGTPALGEYESPTVASLVADTNKPSNNFYAEMLLKRLVATDGRQGTTEAGAKAVERFAKQLGSKVDARDGSGLTDANRASARDVVRLLAAVRDERGIGAPLFNSLAIAGKDGTLADRMNGTVAAGRCRGKTGTINGVSNLSGYCRAGGRLIAFSILMNGVDSYDYARSIQDRMVVEIARYRP